VLELDCTSQAAIARVQRTPMCTRTREILETAWTGALVLRTVAPNRPADAGDQPSMNPVPVNIHSGCRGGAIHW
jgi:hypothetical protein